MVDPYEVLDGIEERVNAMHRQALAVRDEMATVSVTERSRDGQITVTVNHMGNLTALEIGSSARSDPSLGQDILRTVQAAQSKLADAMREGVPSAQATPETMSSIVAQMREMFPEPAPDEYMRGGDRPGDQDTFASRFLPDDPAPAPPPQPRPTRARSDQVSDDDDYYSSGDFFR
ncbi:YbaB/EbfC family nucleoid-associated protein [Actinokineospora iranica]|uniref:Conserved DNA-binding protein YbaB n=1 Tax=Actinokineospora iranica TaxID=1271860 RepID=A0A1G6M0B8_9PSEU|nr:YbaB/EbfC family nucleoid-associated protein [Actinokineospora iranica]SDC48435.1 Conserved DNA-binding protein YbaB [Actinokineospora iranica]